MAACMAGLRGKVTISYSSYDIKEDRRAFPSSLILQVFRIKEGSSEADYNMLFEALGEAAGFSYRTTASPELDESDWWLNKLVEGELLKDGMESIKANYQGVVHKAMEMCGKGNRDRLKLLAQSWLIEEDRAPEDLKRLLKIVDAIMKSKLWQRMCNAKEKYFEAPFSIVANGKVITGAIDLVFKEGDSWVIVDYKTDDFESDKKKKAAYEQQLTMYSKLWEKISGEKVKEKMLCRVSC